MDKFSLISVRACMGLLLQHGHCLASLVNGYILAWGYGATAARLTPDQKVGSSNLSALSFINSFAASSMQRLQFRQSAMV